MKQILGVDIGGVIIDRANDNTDTSFFSENFLNTTATQGVFQALQKLVDGKFGEDVHLVSKCGKKVQEKTLLWLKYHKFYEVTGINPEAVHFCRERHEKAGICEKLGITHFVDDRLEVLGYLTSVKTRYLYCSVEREVLRFAKHLPSVIRVQSWQEIISNEIS